MSNQVRQLHGAKPETGKKKAPTTKVNRTSIDEAHGATNKVNRAKRLARHSEANKTKGNGTTLLVDGHFHTVKNWKRKNGPARQRRTAKRYLMNLWKQEKA